MSRQDHDPKEQSAPPDTAVPAGGTTLAESLKKITRRTIREEPQAVQILLDSLPLEDRVRLVMNFSGRDRLELILLSTRAEELTQALPAPELWITVKEVGEEDAIDLLRLASPAQLQHFFDLEWWHHETIDPLAVAYWLMLLHEAGPDKITAWFQNADEELLVSAFSKFFKVYKADPDQQGQEPFRAFKNLWTLDDVYYLHFQEPGIAIPVEQALSVIRAEEPMRYYGLLEAVENLILHEQEDAAAHFRMARLMDYGFVPFDEALEIYAPLSDHELKRLEQTSPAAKGRTPPPSPPPAFPLRLLQMPPLLGHALAELDDQPAREDFALGLAALVNRILIADFMDLSRLESVSSALQKALTFVEIGLSRWSENNLPQAGRLLRTHHPFLFFRAGYTKVLHLARKADRLKKEGWFKKIPRASELLDEDGLILEGLCRPRPQFVATAGDKGVSYREFLSAEEVERAERALLRAEFFGHFFFTALGVSPEEVSLLRSYYPGPVMSGQVVWLTAAAHLLTENQIAFKPLAPEAAQAALRLLLTSEIPRRLHQDLRNQLQLQTEKMLRRLASTTELHLTLAREFVDSSLERLQEEACRLDLSVLDPRYFLALVILPPPQTST